MVHLKNLLRSICLPIFTNSTRNWSYLLWPPVPRDGITHPLPKIPDNEERVFCQAVFTSPERSRRDVSKGAVFWCGRVCFPCFSEKTCSEGRNFVARVFVFTLRVVYRFGWECKLRLVFNLASKRCL